MVEQVLDSGKGFIRGEKDLSELRLFLYNGHFTLRYKEWVLKETCPRELREQVGGCCQLYNAILLCNACLVSNFAPFYNKVTGKIENDPQKCSIWVNISLLDYYPTQRIGGPPHEEMLYDIDIKDKNTCRV